MLNFPITTNSKLKFQDELARKLSLSTILFILPISIDFVQFMEDKSDSLKQSMDLSVIGYEEEDITVQGTYKIL